jgi:hypothetical protein
MNNNKIKFEIKKPSIDIKEIIQEIKDFKYEDDIKEVTYQLKQFEDNLSKKVLTVDERINILSRLHLMRDVSGWVIGDILLREENKIKQEVLEWENHKRQAPPRYTTLFDFIREHEDRLGFGKSTAYDYIRIRKNASVDTFLKLGMRKTLIILRLKNPRLAEKLTESTIRFNWTYNKLREKYDEIVEQEKEEKGKKNVLLDKNVTREVVVNTRLRGRNIKNNELLISLRDENERDAFNEILQELMPKIKRMIYNKVKK